MGKFAKKCGIFILLFMMVGIGSIVAAACVGIENFTSDDTEERVEVKFEAITTIEVNGEHIEVEVLEGKEYKLVLSEGDGDCSYDINEGILKIKQENDEFLSKIIKNIKPSKVTIYIPKENAVEVIYVNSNVSNVKIDCSLKDATIDLENNVGNIKIDGEILANIDVETNVGNVNIDVKTNEKVYKFDLDSQLGNVSSSGEMAAKDEAKYTITVDSNVGNIKVKVENK